ncbi:hypothetical protein A8W25_28415 [Streptomyces sp. ERV7]|nr:hypothetical protein A8W25_28415 [Streptomyces sp. ERV7]
MGVSDDHGVLARPTTTVSAHLAHWYLTAERFEPLPATPDLYRLTGAGSHQDARRRAIQVVHDLRHAGFAVDADYSLDPALTSAPPRAANRPSPAARHARIAQAARTSTILTAPPHHAAPRTAPPLPTTAALNTGRGQGR